MIDIHRVERTHRMSQMVIAGGLAFVAGQVTNTPYATIENQTLFILKKIADLLKSAGIEKSAIVSANIWLTDVSHFDAFNRVWDEWVAPEHAPARACVQAQLMMPGLDVEVSVVAKI
jgi:enamine deaminase RidA (YjgF/YER057c/UK114 family)